MAKASWLTRDKEDAINLIKQDHDDVEEVFKRFEKAEEGSPERRQAAAEALKMLKAHALMEEEIFYPTLRAQAEVPPEIMDEADEEHHVAKVLIAELDAFDKGDLRYEAKFEVLAEGIRHHVKEEESEMLPKARKMDVDFTELGRRMLARKRSALQGGFPPTTEEQMVASEDVRAPSIARQKAQLVAPR